MSLGLMMSAESDLMLPYSDNLLHGGDFGELDRVMLTADLFEGVTIPQLDFDSGDLFSSSINDRDSYDDEKSMWNGDIGKQGVAESEENKAATNKMHHLSLESMEETPFVQFTEAKLEPEPSILMGYSSATNVITSSYPSLNYTAPPLVSPNSQLPTSFGQASVVSTQQISLPNGQGSLPNGQSGLSNGPIGLPNGQMNMSNGSSDILTRSASKELVLDDNEIFSSPLQFSSAPMTGTNRSIEVGRFVTKEDVSEDSLSPLPTYTHKPCMMQRSFSSHSLGQLRITPTVQEPTSFYPQYSTPMYSSVLELSSPDLQGMNIRPRFKAMRRVCSAGDIQTLNGIQMSHGSTSPLTPDNLSIEEAGFKIGRYSAEERKERIHRYRMKRSERNFNKKIKYACRKTLADSRPRIRGRFARNEDAGDVPTSSHHDEDDEDEVDAVQEDDDDFLLRNNSGTHAREIIRIRSFQRSNGYPFGF